MSESDRTRPDPTGRSRTRGDRRQPGGRAAQQRRALQSLVPPVADELGRRFEAAGFELHLVGGSVRDALLGRFGDGPKDSRTRGVTDLDFATDATPDEVLALLRGWAAAIWEIGREFGTIGAQRGGGPKLEITTFRAEAYDGVSRNPAVRYGKSLVDDLSRRDFAINAMAVSVPGHVLTDPYGGRRDLRDRVIRTPGPPGLSFGDDPLRMLRAARFASQLAFRVAPEVVDAMRAMAGDLDRITVERIQAEFAKLVLGADPASGLRLLVATGLAELFLPELPALRLAIDEHAQHKDVYEHTLTVLENAIRLEGDDGPDLVLRLAALLHDIGKPATKAIGSDGRVSFHHHEVVGAKLARRRLKALRFPTQIVDDVAELVLLHLRFYGYGRGEWTDSAVRRYVTDAGALLTRLHKLTRSDCTTRNRRRAAQLAADYDALEERIARIAAEEDLARVRPDLDGNEIMRLLGIPPGPLVGQAWRHLKELRLDRGPLSAQEAKAELLAWARERGLR
ncbi:MAG TPA: CCA tRNA nucleotidyltransferase [Micromonosporaceae bacterium]|jgi:poly(A) polymerase